MKLWKTRLSGRTEEKEVINRGSKPRRKPRMNMEEGGLWRSLPLPTNNNITVAVQN